MSGLILSILGLLALYGTGDLSDVLFVVAFTALFLSRWRKLVARERPAIYAILVILGLSALFIVRLRFSPVIVAGYALVATHVIAWFSIAKDRIRMWDLPLTFLEISLAAALSPDFYLAIIIIVYIVLASQELGMIAAQQAGFRSVPKSMRHSITRAMILSILLGIILFPFLPRTKTGLEIDWARTRIGYADSVDLSKQNLIQQGPPKTLLRIIANDATARTMNRLLRGRVLDYFSGQEWFPKLNKSNYRPKPDSREQILDHITVIREPIDSSILPVPYGTKTVAIDNSYEFAPARRSISNEWTVAFSETKRIQYDISFDVDFPDDPPSASNSKVPERVVTPRIQRLISRVLQGNTSLTSKLNQIQNYFKAEQFETTTDPLSTGANTNLFEEFLIFQRRGNCELFASSAALMLRYSGVPARLVSGFRISRPPVGGFINVTNRDAHAWVEVWNAERGIWVAFDPTPRTFLDYTWFDEWVDRTELAKAIWYQYIVSYDPQSANQKAIDGLRQIKFKALNWSDNRSVFNSPFFLLLSSALAVVAALYALRRSISFSFVLKRDPRELRIRRLNTERIRFEKLAVKGKILHSHRYQALYDEIRFGPKQGPLTLDLQRLRNLRNELTRA